METLPAAQLIETLISLYGNLVFHTIYGLTGDWEESQDLTQNTFLQALRALDAAREASGMHFHAKAWLLRIAVNTVRMQRRRRSLMRFIPFSRLREAQREEDDTDWLSDAMAPVQPAGYGTPDTGDPAEVVAEREAIQRTLAQLPEALRTPLLLFIVGGLSSTEIAALLELGEAAVRQRLSRARQQFRRLYATQSGDILVDTAATTRARLLPGRDARVPAPARWVPLRTTA
jgi:RNA polymerase sigma-70 factor, ECF subfamily